jgi:hypothetical protein
MRWILNLVNRPGRRAREFQRAAPVANGPSEGLIRRELSTPLAESGGYPSPVEMTIAAGWDGLPQ